VHAQRDPTLDALKTESLALNRVLRDEDGSSKELHDVCSKSGGNVSGRFMAHLYFRHEARVLECMNAFFGSRGFAVGVLVFDGLMIERRYHHAAEATRLPRRSRCSLTRCKS
jgi:hypothetical protein